MKVLITCICLCFTAQLLSQSNTEVFLYDLEIKDSKIEVKNPKNISNNEGYDNQPTFLDDRYILFASTRNGQTDIAKYDTRYDSKSWLNFTKGGEYSPLKVPNKNEISAVRLDQDGKQRLYSYNASNGESKELIQDLIVAYYTWFDEKTVVSAVIEEDNLNLYVTNLSEGKSRKYATKVGRSFHNIPNSNLVSYVSKSDDNQWQIKSLDPLTGDTKLIANTMEDVEDICWLDSKTLVSGKDNILYKLRLKRDNNWKQIADLESDSITKITRLTINSEANKILIAGEITPQPAVTEDTENASENTDEDSSNSDSQNSTNEATLEAIIQGNLEAYNARDIDAFMKDYADDVKLYQYPNTLQTEGKKAMRDNYTAWFETVKDLKAVVEKRIVFGNKVIDHERVTANGKILNAVAIYEIENGKIVRVTFMQ